MRISLEIGKFVCSIFPDMPRGLRVNACAWPLSPRESDSTYVLAQPGAFRFEGYRLICVQIVFEHARFRACARQLVRSWVGYGSAVTLVWPIHFPMFVGALLVYFDVRNNRFPAYCSLHIHSAWCLQVCPV
jgi:hypothetical protein